MLSLNITDFTNTKKKVHEKDLSEYIHFRILKNLKCIIHMARSSCECIFIHAYEAWPITKMFLNFALDL